MRIGGIVVSEACGKVLKIARVIASRVLNLPVEDIFFSGGVFGSKKTNKTLSLFEIAETNEGHKIFSHSLFKGRSPAFPNGAAVCELEIDPETGEFLFFDYSLYEPWMSFGVVSPKSELTHFAKIDLPGPRLPHDMGFTENYVILHDLPVVFTESGLRNGMWQIKTEQRGARFGVVPRNGTNDDVKWFETDPCYLYHVANSWEEGDEVVMVACRMVPNNFDPDPAHGQFASMVNVMALHAYAWEWRMNMKTGEITSRQLDDRLSEFPAINQDYAGRKTRYSYHVAMAHERLQRFEGLIKYDLETGEKQEYLFEDGQGGSEPVFAPRTGAKDEDDGYVITFVTHTETGESEVLILDAKKFADGPIARIPLPSRVPAGFHATWADGDKIAA